MAPASSTLVRSTIELPQFQILGHTLRIHFNKSTEQVDSFNGESPRTEHISEEAVCSVYSDRSQIIEAIIHSRYRTVGAEFAAINNGEPEYSDYQAFRQLAKQLANEWEVYKSTNGVP